MPFCKELSYRSFPVPQNKELGYSQAYFQPSHETLGERICLCSRPSHLYLLLSRFIYNLCHNFLISELIYKFQIILTFLYLSVCEIQFLCETVLHAWKSLCRPEWPQTQRSACLCLLSARIKGTYHHTWSVCDN